MSTNDLTSLQPFHYKKTVLTTDKGRIIDLITILNFKEHSIVITTENYEDKIIAHLDKYIIMDDVVIEKSGAGQSLVMLWGDNVKVKVVEVENLLLNEDNFFELSEKEYLFTDHLGFEKIIYLTDGILVENIYEKYEGANHLSLEEYENLRISLGIAEGENEFNDLINPKECGLEKYISYTKGCYIGQEVIARLDAQGKIPKQMVKLSSISDLTKGDKINLDGKEVGIITSVNATTGLGFIRSTAIDTAKEYEDTSGNKIQIETLLQTEILN